MRGLELTISSMIDSVTADSGKMLVWQITTDNDTGTAAAAQLIDLLEQHAHNMKIVDASSEPVDIAANAGQLVVTLSSGGTSIDARSVRKRQLDGIKRAKIAGRYVGGKPRYPRQDIIDYRAAGHTVRNTAERFRCSISTVNKICAAARAAAAAE